MDVENFIQGAYWAILTIRIPGNSPNTGSVMGHFAKLTSTDSQADTIYVVEQILALLRYHDSQEIIQAEQSDRALLCFSSRGMQG